MFQREKSKGKGFTDAADSLISQINKRYNPNDGMKSTRKLKEALTGRYIHILRQVFLTDATKLACIVWEMFYGHVWIMSLSSRK